MAHLSRRAAILAVAGILITIGGCAENPSAADGGWTRITKAAGPSFSLSGTTTSKVIDSTGGTLQTVDGQSITFPAGALSQPTEISITTDPMYVGVDLEPHGITFPAGKEPILTLDYTGSDVSSFQRLAVGYLDETGGILEVLPTTDASGAQQLHAALRHFSKYGALAD